MKNIKVPVKDSCTLMKSIKTVIPVTTILNNKNDRVDNSVEKNILYVTTQRYSKSTGFHANLVTNT